MSAGFHVGRRAPGPWPLAVPFGGGRLAGWWHAPSGGWERPVPVVLCAPLGWEAEATYRTVVRWAELLSATGFAVLRFDYSGTGDSPGADEDAGRLAAWVESVHAAVDEARRVSGSTRVALAGCHLGATLAARAAAERSDVEALVAWAPFTTGRAYVRQIRAYRLLNALPADLRGGPAAADEEAAGYRLTRATVGELERLDLRALTRAPAPHVLLLSREGPPDEALARAWTVLGAEVTAGPGAGWQELMQQPRKSVVPKAVLERSAGFLAGAAARIGQLSRLDPGPEQWTRRWDAGGGVVEESVCVGEGGMMAGVLSRPARGSAESLPTVLFLTTASHHHIGPNRLWVRLGRALSALGLQTFRFDLTGVGDSLLLPGESPTHAYSRESVSEVREAMDALERGTGARCFLLVGLCSGAYLSYHSAVEDPRVAGIVAVNPQTFAWKEGTRSTSGSGRRSSRCATTGRRSSGARPGGRRSGESCTSGRSARSWWPVAGGGSESGPVPGAEERSPTWPGISARSSSAGRMSTSSSAPTTRESTRSSGRPARCSGSSCGPQASRWKSSKGRRTPSSSSGRRIC